MQWSQLRMLVNQPVEGPVLVALSATYGITVADLLSIALVMIAGLLVLSS